MMQAHVRQRRLSDVRTAAPAAVPSWLLANF